MANPEHLAILEQGVEVWNQWRKDNKETLPELSGADLSAADLRGTELIEAKLSEANLSGVVLSGANLSRVNLSEAVLIQVDLRSANLFLADLSGAINWTEEQLEQARTLEGATMPDGRQYEEWIKDRGAQTEEEAASNDN